MEKRLKQAEFAAALQATGAKLKPEVAADPAKALRKMPAKAREQLLAQLGVPGGAKLSAALDGEEVVLRAEAEDRFAGPAPQAKRRKGDAEGAAPVEGRKKRWGRRKAEVEGEAPAPEPGAPAAPPAPPGAAPAKDPALEVLEALAPDGQGPVWKPELPAHQKELAVHPIQPPFAWVRVVADEEVHETTYNVLEPPLTERETRVLNFLEDTLVDVLEIPLSSLAEKQAEQVLLEHVNQVIYDYSILLEEASKAKLLYFVKRDFLGYGIIDAIMRDDLIEDISCDGPHVPIFLYHRKHESLKSNVQFMTHEALDGFVIRLAQRSGKHISIAEPLLDATLPDGSRLNSTLSDEVTSAGSTFTVRKFRQTPFTPTDLVRFGTMSVDLLAYWWLAVQGGASAIYAGGTASGKTTSLNAIMLFIPPTMKIVTIEDTREVNLPHPNWIPGITRSGFGPRDSLGRQAGEIDMFTLLRAALRQRPEYILVGEVRGAEAFNLFQAMATGHTAYGTLHADSVEAVIHRLESEPIKIPRSLLEALDIVSVQIQTRVGGKRVRRTKELVEIVGLDPHTHEILTNTVFVWNPATDEFEYSGVSYVLQRIAEERNWTPEQLRDEWERRKEILRWLIKRDVRDFKKVGKVITAYYKEPDAVMAYIRADTAQAVSKLLGDALEEPPPPVPGAAGSPAPLGPALVAAPGGAAGAAESPPGPGSPEGTPGLADASGVPTPQEALEAALAADEAQASLVGTDGAPDAEPALLPEEPDAPEPPPPDARDAPADPVAGEPVPEAPPVEETPEAPGMPHAEAPPEADPADPEADLDAAEAPGEPLEPPGLVLDPSAQGAAEPAEGGPSEAPGPEESPPPENADRRRRGDRP